MLIVRERLLIVKRKAKQSKAMVMGWRRAFCTSIPKEERDTTIGTDKKNQNQNQNQHCDNKDDKTTTTLNSRSPRFGSKLGPSTPRLQTQPVSTPSLRCRTTTSSLPNSPKLHSNPSSPKSPSSFSLLKATLRLGKVSGLLF